MNRRGIGYDVGRVAAGYDLRPDLDPRTVRRELAIIRDDLHCTAVRLSGRNLRRLAEAARVAVELGLEAWVSPELWDAGLPATLRHIARAAELAERLRRSHPDRVVFSVGTELSLHTGGFLPGRTVLDRVGRPGLLQSLRSPELAEALNAFLADAVETARARFHGPVSYASLHVEQVDWDPFDLVGIDHYWTQQGAHRYAAKLRRLLDLGKPVVVTEFGFRTHSAADRTGSLGGPNSEGLSALLHILTRGRVAQRVRTVRERDEALQARCLTDQLELLDGLGVDGGFVHTLIEPRLAHGDDPRHDLDADSYGLAAFLPRGRYGTTYPDLQWEPKLAFHALAEYYAAARIPS